MCYPAIFKRLKLANVYSEEMLTLRVRNKEINHECFDKLQLTLGHELQTEREKQACIK